LNTWRPITVERLQSLIEKELQDCTPEQRDVFDKFRVAPRATPIERYGSIESVLVVAQRDDEVMYYEDVEEGFNFSALTPNGQIAAPGWSQDELRYAILRWMSRK
jgi:hypothetical protein